MTKRKSCNGIPFKQPQSMRVYQQIRRSDNPLKTAIKLDVADIPELKRRGFPIL